MSKTLSINNFSGSICVPCIQSKQAQIQQWLLDYERELTPIYTSVDIRDAGFKIAVVDTNLFPAGFNNLCEHGLADAVNLMKAAINKRVPNAKNVLIAAEEHTRNTWYLENVRILQDIIARAGFNVQITTFFNNEPTFCEHAANAVEFETATGAAVKIHCFKRILEKIKNKQARADLIIMNNDLSGGIPQALLEANVPVFPSMRAGWHARHKSEHFLYTNRLIEEFARLVGVDPWQFSCLYKLVDNVDVNSEADQDRLYQAGAALFAEIEAKYKEHGIDDNPFIFIKSDSGTYGLGVVPIEDPRQILELNRRKRNDLGRGKGGGTVHRFLLQEGVPTIHRIEGNPGEVCLYQIDNDLIGGFYRTHSHKSPRENLNSPGGMGFEKICPRSEKYGQDCEVPHNMNIFDIYRILGRIAGIAAAREIKELE
ncbi:MAG: glutamate--cysteine ligase, partial [Candidatus Omnitrophica bacterium]|nr:glutamate--cysteine ligase [Candidatus Omnitrophota bacterium]